jgi:hypothetical protein
MEAYRASMATCPSCGRKFEPDRIETHLRGCKGVTTSSQKSTKPALGAGAAGAAKVHYPVYKKPATTGGPTAAHRDFDPSSISYGAPAAAAHVGYH